MQSPFNAYLQLIGLETLPQRVARQVETATAIAGHLEHTPHVVSVNYSGLPDSPYHALAGKYFPRGVGQILSFKVEGGADHLIRLSIGLEDAGDLMADLDRAIAGAYGE